MTRLAVMLCVVFLVELILSLASMPPHDYLVLQGALFGVAVPIVVVLSAVGALLIRWAWPDHGGYRANRRVNPRTVQPPPGGSAVQPPKACPRPCGDVECTGCYTFSSVGIRKDQWRKRPRYSPSEWAMRGKRQ